MNAKFFFFLCVFFILAVVICISVPLYVIFVSPLPGWMAYLFEVAALVTFILGPTLCYLARNFKSKADRSEEEWYGNLTPLTTEQALLEASNYPDSKTLGTCRSLDLTLLCIVDYPPYFKRGDTAHANLVDPENPPDTIHLLKIGIWVNPAKFHIWE
jgi:hypothetical protein